MNKNAKTSLISATCLVIIGCIIFAGVMSMLNWDFSKLLTVKYETNNYVIKDSFRNIEIISDTANISFIVSNNDSISVDCYEQIKQIHIVEVKDNTLNIKIQDTRKWYEHIGISFGVPKITISIPKGDYGKLSIKSSTGHINISDYFKFENIDISQSTGNVTNYASASKDINIKTTTGDICVNKTSANSINLKVTTGKISLENIDCTGDISIKSSTGKAGLSNVKCNNLLSSGTTGSITLESVVAKGKFSIERDTGDVIFTKCDADELFIETDTGNVKGSLLSDKVFFAKTDTGKVNVPKTTKGGTCDISTDTGNIVITVQ